MNWQTAAGLIAAYAALFGGIYAVVTLPLENRLRRIEEKLDRLAEKLENHGERIVRLEERRFR